MNILLVDDEEEIIELIELYLTKEDSTVFTAGNGIEAMNIILNENIDVAVVDIMMPEMNGLELIKKLRQKINIPVIIISARDDSSDKILGLEIGADDYLAKPFNPLELIARIKAQLRRYQTLGGNAESSGGTSVRYRDLVVNRDECSVTKGGKRIELTGTEYKILECLVQQAGRVYTKKQLYEYIWGENFYGDENVLRIHISNLREKLEPDHGNPLYIKTVRGLGYKLEKEEC